MTRFTESDAVISECGEYRYRLNRTWNDRLGILPFIMLNPSTADAETDDPTIRRCVSFAQREGYGSIVVVNLYGLRATSPAVLWQHPDPIGPGNDAYLKKISRVYGEAVCAWGNHAPPRRVAHVASLLAGVKLRCFGLTRSHQPRHPLYLRTGQPLVPMNLNRHEVSL